MTKDRPAIGRRAVLFGAAAMGLGAFWTGPAEAEQATLTPDAALAKARSGEILLIDVRTPDEWARTGLPEGSSPLDMRRNDFTQALLALVEDQTDRPIALICASGGRSGHMTRALSRAGFTQVIDVPEGMFGSRAGPGWLERGLPLTQP
ncbi:rhodanese-like domain-containing protein [Roseovarius sp. LXJ103]|uniref:rhodanese-like domain-containing protein n=1 Tax=Roseovarius carneus TaxID=2853164 RepID=UPI000D607A2E|nr:rhodanese-like domain-containing protein [Roseovarius carneus]MBZ8118456.1 rhodanese-like domain-containing protein [Roseovarius carneus]PWE35844.1 hypothetical protein DD563_07655 [Pelagicola sp. LXJ1103]